MSKQIIRFATADGGIHEWKSNDASLAEQVDALGAEVAALGSFRQQLDEIQDELSELRKEARKDALEQTNAGTALLHALVSMTDLVKSVELRVHRVELLMSPGGRAVEERIRTTAHRAINP